MNIKERFAEFIQYKGLSRRKFQEKIGVSNSYIQNISNSIGKDILNRISIQYPELNTDWLLTGKGEMLKNSNAGVNINQGGGNIIGQGNHNNIKTGNVVNVALPDAGTQKIIKPDGEIEVITTEANTSMLDTLKRENENLKAEVMYLKNTITTKNDLIDSLRETIDILKNR